MKTIALAEHEKSTLGLRQFALPGQYKGREMSHC